MTNKIWLGANKLDQNPVESGFVTDSSDWKYSSARNYGNDDQAVLEIDFELNCGY